MLSLKNVKSPDSNFVNFPKVGAYGVMPHRRELKPKIHKTRLSNTFYQEKFIKNKKIHDNLFF